MKYIQTLPQFRIPQIITTGEEYEQFLHKVISKAGYKCDTTPATGDQGVDLLVDVPGKKVAIQCKFYSEPVGNNAVQQVSAGKAYYKCNVACVVSNNKYTTAAKQLAQVLNVALLHHSQILEFLGGFGFVKKLMPIDELKKIKANGRAGDIVSAEKLGRMYYVGNGVEKDFTEARKWMKLVVHKDGGRGLIQKRTYLQYILMCEKGIGGCVDLDECATVSAMLHDETSVMKYTEKGGRVKLQGETP